MNDLGKILIVAGAISLVIGVLLVGASHFPFLNRLGKLPGDISVEKENFKFYFPLTTSILLSVVLSLILYFFRKT